MKMSDMKMTDQIAGQEIAGQENAKTRTTCYGLKAVNLCQLRTNFAPKLSTQDVTTYRQVKVVFVTLLTRCITACMAVDIGNDEIRPPVSPKPFD